MDEESVKTLVKTMTGPSILRPPAGTVCPSCGGSDLNILTTMMSGPYSGYLECPCGWRESVMSYIGRRLVSVTPMTLPDNN